MPGCEYCRGEKTLTDKIYEDGTKFDELRGNRIEYIGRVAWFTSYINSKYLKMFKGVVRNDQTAKMMACKWAVDIEYCPKCGTKL